MGKKLAKLALIGFSAAGVVLAGCGGGSAGTGAPGSGTTTLRIRIVEERGTSLVSIGGAHVYAVLGTGQGATALKFAVNSLDPSVHELVRPPAAMTRLFVVSPTGYHRVVQYPYTPSPNVNNYQMPSTAPFDTTLYAAPEVGPPFEEGIIEIGPARLYPESEPPPRPNYP
jgi:hypothetical protein